MRPAFPAAWRTASIERLRVGDGFAALRFQEGRIEVRWQGARGLTVRGAGGASAVNPGGTVVLPVP